MGGEAPHAGREGKLLRLDDVLLRSSVDGSVEERVLSEAVDVDGEVVVNARLTGGVDLAEDSTAFVGGGLHTDGEGVNLATFTHRDRLVDVPEGDTVTLLDTLAHEVPIIILVFNHSREDNGVACSEGDTGKFNRDVATFGTGGDSNPRSERVEPRRVFDEDEGSIHVVGAAPGLHLREEDFDKLIELVFGEAVSDESRTADGTEERCELSGEALSITDDGLFGGLGVWVVGFLVHDSFATLGATGYGIADFALKADKRSDFRHSSKDLKVQKFKVQSSK